MLHMVDQPKNVLLEYVIAVKKRYHEKANLMPWEEKVQAQKRMMVADKLAKEGMRKTMRLRKMKLDSQILDCIKRGLVDEIHPSKIIVFGSFATGSATSESDVDILAVVGDDQDAGHEATVKGRLAIRKALKAIEKNIAFDLILSKQAIFESARLLNGTIQNVADQQGVVIYGD